MADLVSVIVPVYGVAAQLPRCLDSLLAQICGNMEIIAVDDGSPDESGAILDRYAAEHGNLRVIHQENGGVTSARLRGIQEAAGDWIGFCDGDDVVEPEMYQRLLKNAHAYDADISHCGYRMVFPDGRVHFFYNTGRLVEQDRSSGLRDLLDGSMVEPGLCNKLYRRELFQALAERMDASIRINEDLLMNYYLFTGAKRSVFDDWCPYHYMVRSASSSRAKLNQHQIYDPIRVKDIIRRAAEEDIRRDAQRAYVNTCLNVYHSLISAGPGYERDAGQVRELLRREAPSFPLLGKKRALMARFAVLAPGLYQSLYGVYRRFLQKNVYS